ncbi:hypothetical protein ACFYW6_17905 [Streptomyces sp. NPDC002659]|uniref:hypothetical protein n=1 Tax=Streptomyces sp. NPDC002659 TaxID=3364656 RepID=UPI0036C94B50
MTESATTFKKLPEYPEWVMALPRVHTDFPGAEGRLMSSPNGQLVFWLFATGGSVPQHKHGPQLGFVVSGSVLLQRSGCSDLYRSGESFSIADGEPHGAEIEPGTLVMEVFSESDRHREWTP